MGDEINFFEFADEEEEDEEDVHEYDLRWGELKDQLNAIISAQDDAERMEQFAHMMGLDEIPLDPTRLDYYWFSRVMKPVIELAEVLDYNPDTGYTTFSEERADILSRLHSAYNMLQFRLVLLTGEQVECRTSDQILHDMQPTNLFEFDNKYALFEWAMAQARRLHVRHHEDSVYSEHVIETNGRCVRTHFWKRIAPIEEFFPARINSRLHAGILSIFINNPRFFATNTTATSKRNILAMDDPRFPPVTPSRRYISFRDGVYDIWEDVFMSYTGQIPEGIFSAHFIDSLLGGFYHGQLDEQICPYWNASDEQMGEIRHHMIHTGNEFPLPNFGGLETPLFEMMMDSQHWDPYTKFWFMFMVGRLLRPIGEHDNYQVLLILCGVGGSGKSEMVKVINRFFPSDKITQLETRMESNYGLANMPGKFLWVLEELGERTSMAIEQFKKIIDGAIMQISKKYETARDERITAQGIITTNTDIGTSGVFGKNTQGSTPRRLVIFPYRRKPNRESFISDLSTKIDQRGEVPRILRKCNLAYLIGRRLIDEQFGGNFWAVMPPMIQDEYMRMMMHTEDVLLFIMSDPNISLGPECAIRTRDLRHYFDTWQSQRLGKNKHVVWGQSTNQATYELLECVVKTVNAKLQIDLRDQLELDPETIMYNRFDAIRDMDVTVISPEQIEPDLLVIEPQARPNTNARRIVSNEYVFGIAFQPRNPTRVIPSFVQRVLLPLENEGDILSMTDMQKYVKTYQRRWYKSEDGYTWDHDMFVRVARRAGYVFTDDEEFIYARLK